MKVFLYIRVSTKEQLEGYSIESQKERLLSYAKSKDYTVVKTYTDGGYSGANIDRPAIKEMIDNISSVDGVVVHKLDRLSRSQKDTLYLIEEVFLKNNVDFISLSESFDTSTPFGRAMIGILSVFAQLEREQINERTSMGRLARAKEGYYHGGSSKKVPIGYNYVDGELVVNEYEAECVRYIFDEYMNGKGTESLYIDVKDKFPNVLSGASVVRKVLERQLYKGYVKFDNQHFKGRHEPIIDEGKFDAVQKMISKRRGRFTKRSPYILSGLLTCGYCSAGMSGQSSSAKYRYYTCYSKRGVPAHMVRDKNCPSKAIRKELLENEIIEKVSKLKLSDVKVDKKEDNRIGKLQKELNKINDQVSNMVDLYSLGNVPTEVIKKKIDEFNAKRNSLEKRIDELSDNKVDKSEVKKTISSLKDFKNLSEGKQQAIIFKLINNITISEDEIVIDWLF